MRVAIWAAVFLVIAAFFLSFNQVLAIEYFGGKIVSDRWLSRLAAIPGIPRLQLRVETYKLVGAQIVRQRETIYVGGAVLGICKAGSNLLGGGVTIRGRKVMTFGFCK